LAVLRREENICLNLLRWVKVVIDVNVGSEWQKPRRLCFKEEGREERREGGIKNDMIRSR
jgi:hypothetical protein